MPAQCATVPGHRAPRAQPRSTGTLLACLLIAGMLANGCARPPDEAAGQVGRVLLAVKGPPREGLGAPARAGPRGAALAGANQPAAVPADFPSDVYLPDDYRVRSVMAVGGAQVLSLSATGTPAQLFAEARDAMARQDWTLGTSMQQDNEASMLAFQKGQRAAVLSFAGGADGQVEVGVQLRPLRRSLAIAR